MKKGKDVFQKLSIAADLADEAIPHQPLVEIVSDCRVLIENHKGLTEYCAERITARVEFGSITVRGFRLKVVKMTNDQLIIFGKIIGVDLCGRC